MLAIGDVLQDGRVAIVTGGGRGLGRAMTLGLAQVWTAGINVSGVPVSLQTTLGSGQLFGRIPWIVILAGGVVAVGCGRGATAVAVVVAPAVMPVPVFAVRPVRMLLRTVRLSIGVRSPESPSTSAGSMSYSFATT